MTRAAGLVAALSLSAACSPDAPQPCPGEAVGSFTFDATLATTVPLAEEFDPDPLLTDCPGALAFPERINFGGTLAAEPGTKAIALCRASGLVLFGEREEHWVVQTSSRGAALDACGSTCVASSLVVISGDVLPDAASPDEFVGGLVEQLTPSAGDCGACALPCAARYHLVGTAEADP